MHGVLLFTILFLFQVLFYLDFLLSKHYEIHHVVCSCSFALLNEFNTISMSIQLQMDISVVSTFRLLCMFLGVHMNVFLRLVELLCHQIYILMPVFQNGCTNLNSVTMHKTHSCLTFLLIFGTVSLIKQEGVAEGRQLLLLRSAQSLHKIKHYLFKGIKELMKQQEPEEPRFQQKK